MYNWRVVPLLVAVVFLLDSTAYGIDLSDKNLLRKYLDFPSGNERDSRYNVVLLTAKLQQYILKISNKVPPEEIAERVMDNFSSVFDEYKLLGAYVEKDKDGNIWIYHGPDGSDPKGTYIELYTIGENQGQFEPKNKEDFDEAFAEDDALVMSPKQREVRLRQLVESAQVSEREKEKLRYGLEKDDPIVRITPIDKYPNRNEVYVQTEIIIMNLKKELGNYTLHLMKKVLLN